MENTVTFRNILWSTVILGSLLAISSVIELFLGSITMAFFLYYSSRPLFKRIHNRIRNRTYSALITLFVTFIPLVIFTFYIIQLGYSELQRILFQYDFSAQTFIPNSLRSDISLLSTPTQIIESENGTQIILELLDWSVIVFGIVGDVFLRLIIIAVVYYYLLKDDIKFTNWATNNFGSITPHWSRFWRKVDQDLHNIYFGNILNAIIAMSIAIIIAFIYSFFAPDPVDIPYPILFGILAGISSLIPIIGVKVAYVPVALYMSFIAYTTDSTGLFAYIIVFVLFSAIVLDFLQDIIIRSYISSGQSLHMGLLLIAYISGPLLLGWYGFFFAPVVLVLIYHFSDIILPDIIAKWF